MRIVVESAYIGVVSEIAQKSEITYWDHNIESFLSQNQHFRPDLAVLYIVYLYR